MPAFFVPFAFIQTPFLNEYIPVTKVELLKHFQIRFSKKSLNTLFYH